MPHRAFALSLLLLAAAAPARATQLCGWLTEKVEDEDVHHFELWLQADGEAAFLYRMTGRGVVTASGHAYSPSSGTFTLRPGKAERPWGFGSNLDPPGDIDIVAEIHVSPKSIFDEEETPLLAKFSFQRHVSQGETRPPTDFQQRQCATLAPSK